MSDPRPGTCELCKHWDAFARTESARLRAEGKLPYYYGACTQIDDWIEISIEGGGVVEAVETSWHGSCGYFAPIEDATQP